MHNHNNNKEGGGNGMMWMMIPCLLLLGVLFLGGGKWSGGGYLGPILIGIFVIAHVWMMFKGHGNHGDKTDNTSLEQPNSKDEHNHNGSCH